MLVAADIYRPAAIDQLKVLGEQIGIEVYTEPENKNAVYIATNAVKEARSKNKNVIIIDTAGRLAMDEVMMAEVANIKNAVNPQEILFVVDAMTGQDAVNTAKTFNERLDFSGVVLTKLDGDTRGGAALSIKYTVNKPIKFVSSGENWKPWMCFIPKGWPNVYWVWVILLPWWKRRKISIMKKKPENWKERYGRISSISRILCSNWRRSRKWVT